MALPSRERQRGTTPSRAHHFSRLATRLIASSRRPGQPGRPGMFRTESAPTPPHSILPTPSLMRIITCTICHSAQVTASWLLAAGRAIVTLIGPALGSDLAQSCPLDARAGPDLDSRDRSEPGRAAMSRGGGRRGAGLGGVMQASLAHHMS